MLPLIPCFGAISDGNPDEQALALCRAGFWGHIYVLHCPSVQNLWTNKSVQYTVRDSFANMVSVKVDILWIQVPNTVRKYSNSPYSQYIQLEKNTFTMKLQRKNDDDDTESI